MVCGYRSDNGYKNQFHSPYRSASERCVKSDDSFIIRVRGMACLASLCYTRVDELLLESAREAWPMLDTLFQTVELATSLLHTDVTPLAARAGPPDLTILAEGLFLCTPRGQCAWWRGRLFPERSWFHLTVWMETVSNSCYCKFEDFWVPAFSLFWIILLELVLLVFPSGHRKI